LAALAKGASFLIGEAGITSALSDILGITVKYIVSANLLIKMHIYQQYRQKISLILVNFLNIYNSNAIISLV
jgi:hypothetical protein